MIQSLRNLWRRLTGSQPRGKIKFNARAYLDGIASSFSQAHTKVEVGEVKEVGNGLARSFHNVLSYNESIMWRSLRGIDSYFNTITTHPVPGTFIIEELDGSGIIHVLTVNWNILNSQLSVSIIHV